MGESFPLDVVPTWILASFEDLMIPGGGDGVAILLSVDFTKEVVSIGFDDGQFIAAITCTNGATRESAISEATYNGLLARFEQIHLPEDCLTGPDEITTGGGMYFARYARSQKRWRAIFSPCMTSRDKSMLGMTEDFETLFAELRQAALGDKWIVGQGDI